MQRICFLAFIVGALCWPFSKKSSSSESSSVGEVVSSVSSTTTSAAHSTEPPLPLNETVLVFAKSSSCNLVQWKDRGRSPLGYIPGIALVYAKNLCDLRRGKPSAVAMASTLSNDSTDALVHYGLRPTTEVERLRSTFSLLIGLGMMESSGSYCEGRDASASNSASDTAEAGLWQTSFNAAPMGTVRRKLYEEYKNNTINCDKDIFAVGVKCTAQNLKNYGSGEGRTFQEFTKSCPGFAAEHAAINLRFLRRHYGPINIKAAQIKTECTDLLKTIEEVVNQDGCK